MSTESHQEHLGVQPQDLENPRGNDDIAHIASVLVEPSPVLDFWGTDQVTTPKISEAHKTVKVDEDKVEASESRENEIK